MRRIINTHDQLVAAGGGIALTKSHAPRGERRTSGMAVYRVNAEGTQMITDMHAAWYDNHCKTFLFDRLPTKGATLEEAKAWMLAKYDEHGPWTRNKFGDYLPTRIAKQFPIPRTPKT